MKAIGWLALLVAIAANIGANTALKHAMNSVSLGSGTEAAFQMLQNMSFWIGLLLAAVLLLSYLIAIRQMPISVAYLAVTSLAMIGLVAVDSIFFGLRLTATHGVGVGLVVAGLYFVMKSSAIR